MVEELRFPAEWFAAGVVTAASAAEFAKYARRDPAKRIRYWRWMAFRDFLEEHTPLDADRCAALFELGRNEEDGALGTAMMCSVLHQPNCPAHVKREAASSGRDALRRAAVRH